MEMVAKQGLYDPCNEHDACGVGFVVNIKGRKSHDLIRQGLKILVNLDHRGAVGADPLVGDGAGCLIQMPDRLLHDWADKAGKRLPRPGRGSRLPALSAQSCSSRSGIWIRQPAPSPTSGSAPTAPRWVRLFSMNSPSTMS